MIRQLAIIFGCLALGELVIYLTGIPLPSSIVGMLLLTMLLKLKVIRLEWVKAELVPILAASVISTILVLAVTGWMHQFYGKAKDKSHDIFKHK